MARLTILLLLFALIHKSTAAQNASINVQIQQSGIVKIGKTIFLEVWINNTDADYPIPVYKLRPQISVPIKIVSIAAKGHVLPKGWAILSNENGVIRLTNGNDIIAANDARTILIALKGIAAGGPFTIAGNLTFSNGIAPGNISGTATINDNQADNTSTTTCKTIQ